MSPEIIIVLLAGLVSANLPFVSQRFLLFIPIAKKKNPGLALLELLIWLALVLAFGIYLEARQGNVFTKGWEFYAISVCLFLVAAFPGFVWRYLRKARG